MDNFLLSVSEEHSELVSKLERELPRDNPPRIVKDRGIDHYGELLQLLVPISSIALTVLKFYLDNLPKKDDAETEGEVVITVGKKRIELTGMTSEEVASILDSVKEQK